MPMTDDEYVRLRAYQLWIQEGPPEGQEYIHWHRARREVELSVSQPERPLDMHLSPQDAGEIAKERP